MTWVIQNCIHLRFFHPQKGYIICWIDNQDPEYNKSLQQLNYHLDWPVLIIAQAEAVFDILTEKVLWACLALKRMHFTQEIKHTIESTLRSKLLKCNNSTLHCYATNSSCGSKLSLYTTDNVGLCMYTSHRMEMFSLCILGKAGAEIEDRGIVPRRREQEQEK